MKKPLLFTIILSSLSLVSCKQTYINTKKDALQKPAFSRDGTPNSGSNIDNGDARGIPTNSGNNTDNRPDISTDDNTGDDTGDTGGNTNTNANGGGNTNTVHGSPSQIWSCSIPEKSLDCKNDTVHDLGAFELNLSDSAINTAAHNEMIRRQLNKEGTCVKLTNTIGDARTDFQGAWHAGTSHSCTLSQKAASAVPASANVSRNPLSGCSELISALSTYYGTSYTTKAANTQAQVTLSLNNSKIQMDGFNFPGVGTAYFCAGNSNGDCSPSNSRYLFALNLVSKDVRVKDANYDLRGCVVSLSSPLVVDLGRGVRLSDPEQTQTFLDIDGDGEDDRISCIQEGAFLALPDSNGSVNDINELFGDNTIGPDGKKSANGFLALAKYDEDRDGMITANDSAFDRLKLWKDENCDGKAARHELRDLESAMISMIDLDYMDMMERDAHGNETRQRSVVELINGKLMQIVDIWFAKH